MSLLEYKKYIEEGDLVISYFSRENMIPIIINPKSTYNNKFGTFRHSDMIGKEYGIKLLSHNGKGFMYLLHPTPELWTYVVPHRTQILYVADTSFITTYLDLKPGSIVLESGTGSGSFSHSLAVTIAPHGHLYTFEYHEERAKAAKQDFEEHNLSDIITIECKDVCKNGFGLKDLVDSVFLDLPAPWNAILSAKETFKQNRIGKICCFSPCIEQVQKTCAFLNENGFVEIKMFECLIRNHEVRTIPIYKVEDAINHIKAQKEKKRKRKEEQLQQLQQDEIIGSTTSSSTTIIDDNDHNNNNNNNSNNSQNKQHQDCPNLYVTKTPIETRGHTSYLTFATFLPNIILNNGDDGNNN